MKEDNFTVFTLTDTGKCNRYCHWADELSMIITKGNTTIRLESKDIIKLVKTLPRTMSGRYF